MHAVKVDVKQSGAHRLPWLHQLAGAVKISYAPSPREGVLLEYSILAAAIISSQPLMAAHVGHVRPHCKPSACA